MFHGKKARRLDELLSGTGGSPTPSDRPYLNLLRTAQLLGEVEEHAQPSRFIEVSIEERLMREAAELRRAGPDTPPRLVRTTAHKYSVPPRREWDVQRRRRVFWQLATVAAALMLFIGSLVMASQATPDSPLFALRRLERTVQLQLAFDPEARAVARIGATQDSYAELHYSLAQRNTSAYRANLSDFQSCYQAASDAVAAEPSAVQRARLASSLAETLAQAVSDLRQALNGMDWSDRLATTATLSALGEATPDITQVTYTHAAGDLRVRITGAGFLPGARIYINGRPAGEVRSVTPDTIQATLPSDTALAGGVLVGVSNSDGTAAQFTLAASG
jgi:hypothetical protein